MVEHLTRNEKVGGSIPPSGSRIKLKDMANSNLINAKREKNEVKDVEEMNADHVAAWSKGGATSAKNCEMLCKTHYRAKGNR